MKRSCLSHFLSAFALMACAATPGFAGKSTVAFSDPTKPGQLIIRLGLGDVVIHGEDTDQVTVSSDDVDQEGAEREDGLRRLDGGAGFSVTETNNIATITLPNAFGGHRGGAADVEVTVPRATRITLERTGPGDVEIHDVSGDLELRGTVGDIVLAGVSGGVLIESVNGDVQAEFAELSEGKPVSISVVHGDVELHVPSDARANVRFRTMRGEMLTDFDESELQTRFENANGQNNANAMSDAEKAALQAQKDQARAEADRIKAEVERAKAEAEAAAAAAVEANGNIHVRAPNVNIQIPMPPRPPMPPIVGGKLVVGTLNGGGTDLIVTTLTGDIVVRRN